MDVVTFASVVIKTLFSWPVILFIIVLIFKKEIVNLMGRVSEINIGKAGAKFRELLGGSSTVLLNATMSGELSVDVPISEKTINKVLGAEVVTPEVDEFSLIEASLLPRGRIMSAWLTLEKEIIKFAKIHGTLQDPKEGNIRKLLTTLRDKGLITGSLYMVSLQLLQARNEAVHLTDKELTDSDFETFAATAKGAYRGFRNQGRLSPID